MASLLFEIRRKGSCRFCRSRRSGRLNTPDTSQALSCKQGREECEQSDHYHPIRRGGWFRACNQQARDQETEGTQYCECSTHDGCHG